MGKRNGVAVAALTVIVGLTTGCGGGSDSAKEAGSTAANTTVETAATTTAETATEVRPAPTDAQLKESIEAFVNERSNSGVRVAQAVTSVTASGGVVTVTVDAAPVVLELTPFDNLAKVFGTPAAFNDEEGVWLRRTLRRVDVVDAAGNSLGSMTAAELNKMGAG